MNILYACEKEGIQCMVIAVILQNFNLQQKNKRKIHEQEGLKHENLHIYIYGMYYAVSKL